MVSVYCGNNKLDPSLVNGEAVVGSVYECFRKGIGLGKSLPLDTTEYEPIDNIKIWCGNKPTPSGYQNGDRTRCLMKGVGVGKGIRARENVNNPSPTQGDGLRFVIVALVNAFAIIGSFSALYIWKPSIVAARTPDGRRVIKWREFILVWSACVLVCASGSCMFLSFLS